MSIHSILYSFFYVNLDFCKKIYPLYELTPNCQTKNLRIGRSVQTSGSFSYITYDLQKLFLLHIDDNLHGCLTVLINILISLQIIFEFKCL